MLNKNQILSLLLSLFLGVYSINGQESTASLKKANQLLQAGKPGQAKSMLQKITASQPENGQAWFRLGSAYHQLKEYEKAVDAYHRAEELHAVPPQFTRYNIACAYALDGKKTKAFESLDGAILTGFGNVELLNQDEDLANLRDDPQFDDIVQRADKNARPCEYDEKYRQLDFWLGHWAVFNPQGQQVGENTIERHLEGCMIQENWQGRYGSAGKSLNYYDPEINAWRQQWVSANGSVINYEGHFKDGAMHYAGKNIAKDGTVKLSRMILTPRDDGTVRQLIEQSNNQGKTWNVWFDGIYRPME